MRGRSSRCSTCATSRPGSTATSRSSARCWTCATGALAEVARADDFIVSDRLVSLMIAQVAENKHLNAVFGDLLDPEGSEIYLKPAGDYVQLGQAVPFAAVIEAARRRGEIAFGYRIAAHRRGCLGAYGVSVNPAKTATVTFAAADRIVVLAED